MTDLEVLHEALMGLKTGKPFLFRDWTQCTCGHIYAAATGGCSALDSGIQEPNPETVYGSAITAAARALGWTESYRDHDDDLLTPAEYVSMYTFKISKVEDEKLVQRRDAIEVIEQAIRAIQTADERARLDVLAQVQAVVDAAEPEVVLGC